MKSKTALMKIKKHRKYDRLYGPLNQSGSRTTQKHQKCDEITRKMYITVYSALNEDVENV